MNPSEKTALSNQPKFFRRLPEESLGFIMNSVMPFHFLIFAYLILFHNKDYWIYLFLGALAINIYLSVRLLKRTMPIETTITVNLLIFSGAGYVLNPQAPYWLLYLAPIVAIALTVERNIVKYFLLTTTFLLCAMIGFLKGVESVNTATSIIALGITAVFAVRINQFLGKQHAVIAREREISDKLLENILPSAIAKRMKSGEVNIADSYESVAILFVDIVGFTKYSEKRTPEELVKILDLIFSLIDGLAKKNNLEKIKTIGDSYMVASGLPEPDKAYLENMAFFALNLKNEFAAMSLQYGFDLEVRIGIHCGRVVAGVIGREKFLYDVWGDVVNIASRMESHGQPGMVHCSESIYDKLKEKFDFKSRGTQEIKGKGPMNTYFLLAKLES